MNVQFAKEAEARGTLPKAAKAVGEYLETFAKKGAFSKNELDFTKIGEYLNTFLVVGCFVNLKQIFI